MVCCFTNLSCNKSLYSLGRRYNGNYALHNLENNFLSSCMGYLNMESKKKPCSLNVTFHVISINIQEVRTTNILTSKDSATKLLKKLQFK